MTINEAISIFDKEVPNGDSQESKLRWLTSCENSIITDVYATNEVVSYGADDLNTELKAPPPYDEMYIYFLEERHFYNLVEPVRQNNAAAAFYEIFEKYKRNYRREHPPKGCKHRFF